MKKIIVAFDGLKYSGSANNYAIEISKHANTHLVGVFLDDITYHSYKIYELINNEGISEARQHQLDEKDDRTRAAAAGRFELSCQKAGLNYSIHHDRSVALQELLHESIYADLLVINQKETLTHYHEKLPTRFIRDLLTSVQCPVLLTPAKYQPIDRIVLLYDGEPASVYAIKMFSYLLPLLKHLPAEVVSVKETNNDLHLPDNKLMKEFMKRHFPKATYTVLNGLAEMEIVSHLKELEENSLVVLGAYSRSMVSRWFHESMADVLMKEIRTPLFISHVCK
jgi:hypothetical protein